MCRIVKYISVKCVHVQKDLINVWTDYFIISNKSELYVAIVMTTQNFNIIGLAYNKQFVTNQHSNNSKFISNSISIFYNIQETKRIRQWKMN